MPTTRLPGELPVMLMPLLVLAGRLRGQISNADVDSLRRQAIEEMRTFEERARRAEVPPEDVLAARYALCTVLDEAVTNTPWGVEGNWSALSLLVTVATAAASLVIMRLVYRRVEF